MVTVDDFIDFWKTSVETTSWQFWLDKWDIRSVKTRLQNYLSFTSWRCSIQGQLWWDF